MYDHVHRQSSECLALGSLFENHQKTFRTSAKPLPSFRDIREKTLAEVTEQNKGSSANSDYLFLCFTEFQDIRAGS